MTSAEQKAKELVDKFDPYVNGYVNDEKHYPLKNFSTAEWKKNVKQCAIIAVDEILVIMNEKYLEGAEKIEFWGKVKQSIQSL